VIVAAKKRQTFLPIRSPVFVHLIDTVNIQRNNQGIVQVVAVVAGSIRKGGKKTSYGLSMMLIVKVHSVNCARHMECPLNEQVVYGQQSYSPTGRKLLRR